MAAEDFGLYLYSRSNGREVTFTFLPFRMFQLSVMDEGLYTTTSNIHWNGQPYATTLDFDQSIMNAILRLLSRTLAIRLQDILENVVPPSMIKLSPSLDLSIETAVGTMVSSKNEEFRPFVVKRVIAVEIGAKTRGL